jgi:hypothetical protein
MGWVVQRHAPAGLPPEMTRYEFYRRLGGPPQDQSGRMRKISPSPYSIPEPSSLKRVAIPTELSRPILRPAVPALKQPGCKADHSPTSSVQVKNGRSYNSILPASLLSSVMQSRVFWKIGDDVSEEAPVVTRNSPSYTDPTKTHQVTSQKHLAITVTDLIYTVTQHSDIILSDNCWQSFTVRSLNS